MINNMRMQEIAEVLASRIEEHDQDFAREVLIDELDMEDEELDYFGISKADLGIEEDDDDLYRADKMKLLTEVCGNYGKKNFT